MQADDVADHADPVFDEDEIIVTLEPDVVLLAVRLVQAGRGLVAVERAGHDIGVDDQTAVLDEGHLLVVEVDLDIAVAQREGLAGLVIADGLGRYGAGLHRQQLRADLLRQALHVDPIVAGDKPDLRQALDPRIEQERRVLLAVALGQLGNLFAQNLFVNRDCSARVQVYDGSQIMACERFLAVRQILRGICVECHLDFKLCQRLAEQAVRRVSQRRSRNLGLLVAVNRGQFKRRVLRPVRRNTEHGDRRAQPVQNSLLVQFGSGNLGVDGIDAVLQHSIGVFCRRALHALQVGQNCCRVKLLHADGAGIRRGMGVFCPVQLFADAERSKLLSCHTIRLRKLRCDLIHQIVAQTEFL